MPFSVTVLPTGSRPLKSSLAVSGPRTTTAAASRSSFAVMNRPEVTPRERTSFQLGVVPVKVVVQLVDPFTSEADDVEVAATAWMSGATAFEASAAASCVVSVDAEPKPPRVPVELVLLPGEITRRFVPSSLIWSCTWARAPWPSPTVMTTAVMPMRIPSMVSAERSRWVRTASVAVRKVSRQLTTSPRRAGSARRPGPRSARRGSRRPVPRARAMSRSWVMSTMVRPSRWSASNRSRMSAVDEESRFPVGSSARIIAGSVTSARAIATRCCWPPDSSPGLCSARSPSPTRASAASACSRRSPGATPA